MKCFNMFEAGDIKGQTLTSKQLMTKPEVKQTQFQCLLPLTENIQKGLLSQVLSKELSLKELKKRCEEERKLNDLHEKFVHLTNCKNWKEAETRFPIHTKPDKLKQFLTLNLKKSTPQAFSQFCAEAVLYTKEPESTDVACTAKISDINTCTFVEVANLSSIDPMVVTNCSKMHNGGSIFMAYMDKVRLGSSKFCL